MTITELSNGYKKKNMQLAAGRIDMDTGNKLIDTINDHRKFLKDFKNTLVVDIEGAGKVKISSFGMFSVSVFPATSPMDKPTGVIIHFDDYAKQARQCARLAVRRARHWNPANRKQKSYV